MIKTEKFDKRIGKVYIPIAETVPVEAESSTDPDAPINDPVNPQPFSFPGLFPPFKFCRTRLKEGCYRLSFVPKGSHPIFGRRYRGTLRVETIADGIRFSGDLYVRSGIVFPSFPTLSVNRTDRLRLAAADAVEDADAPGPIPIFSRASYHSYLKGTVASLTSTVFRKEPCKFSLTFEEFRYNHPASGFSGSFPAFPNRTIRFALQHTFTADSYAGTVFEGSTNIGTVTITWISPFFRRATLMIHRLQGAEEPQAVPASGGGNEYFTTVFATAGWDLTVTSGGEVPLPASLVGVQDPNTCWTFPSMATLMESVPGYNPAELDSIWKARLAAIPAALGCSRGWMFDSGSGAGSGNPNDIPREGAVTQSHDGYPAADSPNFGVAENGLQKDFPRAFLRSASHEVGHTFNQIHQELEGGEDNSIMTTTPSVADVLAAAGQTFPNDIHLGFNARVRRHLIHLPDPAVRPGAMDFFGAAVNAPEADQIAWPQGLKVAVAAEDDAIALGEPLVVRWTLTNDSERSVLVPSRIDINSLAARVSVTDPSGKVTFLRPVEQEVCSHNPLREFASGESLSGAATVFWGRDGFTFERPGRHIIEVILLWQVSKVDVGAAAETTVWISFPTSHNDNRVASLMLDPEVGCAVACGVVQPGSPAEAKIAEARSIEPGHPAWAKLEKMGVGTRSGTPATRKSTTGAKPKKTGAKKRTGTRRR